jgi:hypothetical protein
LSATSSWLIAHPPAISPRRGIRGLCFPDRDELRQSLHPPGLWPEQALSPSRSEATLSPRRSSPG